VLLEVREMSGERWSWRTAHFDRLAGTDDLRLAIEAGQSLDQLQAGWAEDRDAFQTAVTPYLLY
jgi:uncharacterized protein YbbC (DUF1343 family)